MSTPSNRMRKRSTNIATFQYVAFDQKHNKVAGEVTATSQALARNILTKQGLVILSIKKKTGMFKLGRKSVSSKEITLFTRQLATLLTAGIPLVQALLVIAESAPNTPLYDLIQRIKLDVESGLPFSIAIRKYPNYFDDFYCSMVETGEQSGTLDVILERLATFKEKVEGLKRKVKKALYYPTAVIVIAFIVTIILLIKVVPTFQTMFEGAGAKLPAFTMFVIHISNAVTHYGLYLLGILILGIMIFVYQYRRNIRFRHSLERLSLHLPIIGSILRKTAIARFVRTLATTSKAGVPLADALQAVTRGSGNIVYTEAAMQIREGLTAGQQMRVMMKRTGQFPPMVVQMVGIGEESGALEDMLNKIAVLYEDEVDTQVDGLTTLLEPLIMVLLGVIVGGLVIAMYLPIFKMGSIL